MVELAKNELTTAAEVRVSCEDEFLLPVTITDSHGVVASSTKIGLLVDI